MTIRENAVAEVMTQASELPTPELEWDMALVVFSPEWDYSVLQ